VIATYSYRQPEIEIVTIKLGNTYASGIATNSLEIPTKIRHFQQRKARWNCRQVIVTTTDSWKLAPKQLHFWLSVIVEIAWTDFYRAHCAQVGLSILSITVTEI